MKRITKKLLHELYIKQGFTKKELAEYFQCSHDKITQLLRKYGIVKSKEQINKQISNSLIGHPPFREHNGHEFNKEQIEELYIKKNLTIKETAQELNCSLNTVERNIQKYDISKSRDLKKQSKQRALEKARNTKRENNSFNTSQPEEEVYALLIKAFGKRDVVRQYKSPLYPFNCDFYIRSLDLYIEYQGSHFHGDEAFSWLNIKHWKRLYDLTNKAFDSKHPQYSNMIEVWTRRDPNKRKVAKANNLNFIELWSVNEAKAFLKFLKQEGFVK